MSIKSPGNGGAVLIGQLADLVGIALTQAAPTVASGVSLGGTTAATATAGAGQNTPAKVVGYLIINVAGTTRKVPFYAT